MSRPCRYRQSQSLLRLARAGSGSLFGLWHNFQSYKVSSLQGHHMKIRLPRIALWTRYLCMMMCCTIFFALHATCWYLTYSSPWRIFHFVFAHLRMEHSYDNPRNWMLTRSWFLLRFSWCEQENAHAILVTMVESFCPASVTRYVTNRVIAKIRIASNHHFTASTNIYWLHSTSLS